MHWLLMRVEHFLNPLHVFCRCMEFLSFYDRLWRRIFDKVPMTNGHRWVSLYREWRRLEKQIGTQLQKKDI